MCALPIYSSHTRACEPGLPISGACVKPGYTFVCRREGGKRVLRDGHAYKCQGRWEPLSRMRELLQTGSSVPLRGYRSSSRRSRLGSGACKIASNRYAPHLSSCMGLSSARRGTARGAVKSKSVPVGSGFAGGLAKIVIGSLLRLGDPPLLHQRWAMGQMMADHSRARQGPRPSALVSPIALSPHGRVLRWVTDDAEFNLKRKRV